MNLFLADQQCTQVAVKIGGNSCVNGIFDYINRFVALLEGLIGVGIVIAIVVSGIQYITSAGSPDAVKSAKQRLTNAIIGLVLYLMLFAILDFLGLKGFLS